MCVLERSNGCIEWENTAEGTRAIGKSLNACTQNGGYTIVGGGDSAAAVGQMELTEDISHISTGGGASLRIWRNVHYRVSSPFNKRNNC